MNGRLAMVDSTPKKLKKGFGRMEFIACKNRINELYEIGCDIQKIYDRLREEGLITMSYSTFYDNYTQRRHKKKTPEPPQHQVQITEPTDISSLRIQKYSDVWIGQSLEQPALEPTGDNQNIAERRQQFNLIAQKNLEEAIKRSQQTTNSGDDPDIKKLQDELF